MIQKKKKKGNIQEIYLVFIQNGIQKIDLEMDCKNTCANFIVKQWLRVEQNHGWLANLFTAFALLQCRMEYACKSLKMLNLRWF